MRLSLIVAMTRAGVIGRAGGLPWRLSTDLKRFKSLTMGHHLIMGRKTYESLGRTLPGRTSVVVTRQAEYAAVAGVLVARSLDEALTFAAGDSEPFIIGGGEIFAVALPRADRLYVTWVEAEIAGDTYFPVVNLESWQRVHCEPIAADAKNEYDTTFSIYDRR
jgi:dihydrofolate reductase